MIFTQGAFNVVIQNSKVLMVKRRDLPLWDLPGGKVEHYETPQQAAIRETHEETGYHVEIFYEYGQYFDNQRKDCQHLFFSQIVDGNAVNETAESRQLRWFSINRLPLNMVPNRRKQIRDALLSRRVSYEIVAKYEISENALIRCIRKLIKL